MERTVKLTLRPKKPAASQMIGKLYAEQTKLATQLYNKTIEAKRLQSELESEKRANADLEKIVSDQLSELNRARDMNAFLRLNNTGNVKEKEQLSNELKLTKLAMQDVVSKSDDLASALALAKGSCAYLRAELEESQKVFRDNQEAYEKTINALRKENRDLLKGEELKDKIIDALGSEINTHLCSLDTAKNQIAQLTQKIAELMRPAPRRILFGMEHANAKQAEEIRVLQAELIERDNLLKELRDRINRDI